MALIARLIVGATLLVAASYKLQARGWAAQTASAMRLPVALVRPTPALEFVVAGLCIAQFRFAGLVAAALLIAYTFVLVPRIGGPPCACFGSAAKPITWWTIARNVGLIAVSLVSFFA